MTLQSLAVLMAGFTLGPVAACSAMLLYLGCGAAGLPVFAPGSAGLFGATGGYLVGFVFAAMTISVLRGRQQASVGRLLFSGATGLSVLFAFGLAWRFVYATIFWLDTGFTVSSGLIPFLPKAIVELLLAVSLTKVWDQHQYRDR
jgi:biotin transport system substrate-specific component